VSAGWVAAQVRSRSLAGHCVGRAGARAVARAGSLEAALGILAKSAYGERVHPGLDLAASGHEVFATVLWNLRVLAGWCPAMGASRLHVLAGVFELVNIEGELARIDDRCGSTPFELGSLASVARHAPPSSMGELREVLRLSPWGDPGNLDPAGVSLALRASLVRRIVDNVPEARAWAETYAALIASRLVSEGVALDADSTVSANLGAVLGATALAPQSIDQLSLALPQKVRSVLKGVTGSQDLWLAEARWWTRLWDESQEKVRRVDAGPQSVVAAVATQAADAWRVRVALEVAARAGRGIEVLDAVA
jgi:hypothetical protein